ncbi:MAG: nickel pincer cofactor biosynthesis protein LarB [Nitrosopumilus sp.]|nr:nickel pincer cofactor biosynthesis protein LarB [Nitrosopumilus sp.]
MDLKDILLDYYNDIKSLDEVINTLSLFSIEYIENNIAQLDVNRDLRKSVPEVVLAINKKTMEIISISNKILEKKGYVIISKIRPIMIKKLVIYFKKKGFIVEEGYKSTSILIYEKIESLPVNKGGKIGIICGGTSDIGIAEEARISSISMGCSTFLGYDVGIAGIHRLLLSLKEMISKNVDVLIVVAGMEGALSSVVTSLVNIPVIGVPSSVGYGFGSNGIGSLSSMLQSCTFGLAVVNIDNGIGAGIFASLIANKGR